MRYKIIMFAFLGSLGLSLINANGAAIKIMPAGGSFNERADSGYQGYLWNKLVVNGYSNYKFVGAKTATPPGIYSVGDVNRAGFSNATIGADKSAAAAKTSQFELVGENIYLYRDICNVYLIKTGNSAVCIDFGSGAVLDHLKEIGIAKIDWILFTHHHRDQCLGAYKAVKKGIKIAVPFNEQSFFNSAEVYFNQKRIHHLHKVIADWNTLRTSVKIDTALNDFDRFLVNGINFDVVPTPGHTIGSSTYLAKINNVTYAFSGDLIRNNGELQTLYDEQYTYLDADGFLNTYYSLNYLKTLNPAVLLPSHGNVISNPLTHINILQAKIKNWISFYSFGWLSQFNELTTEKVVDGLYYTKNTVAHAYVLISKTGEAMLFDFSTLNGIGLYNDHLFKKGGNRFIPYNMDSLYALGVKKIVAVLPTHYHEDHSLGVPYLQKKLGVEVWTINKLKATFENPDTEYLGVTINTPVKINRVLKEGETFAWNEFKITPVYAPGHTQYHCMYFVEINGKRIAITGDHCFNMDRKDANGNPRLNWNVVYLNKIGISDNYETSKKLADYNPDIICPGHHFPFHTTTDLLNGLLSETSKLKENLEVFVGSRSLNEAMSPHFYQVTPLQQTVYLKKPFTFKVILHNPLPTDLKTIVRINTTANWKVVNNNQQITIPVNAERVLEFEAEINTQLSPYLDIETFGVELITNDKTMGEVAHGQVEIRLK